MVVVDDSIVRGTTSRKIVKMLKDAGAPRGAPAHLEPAQHLALLLRHRHALAAGADRRQSHTVEEIARYVTADSLGYLSLQGLHAAVGDEKGDGFCDACFTGKYLTPLNNVDAKPAPVLTAVK